MTRSLPLLRLGTRGSPLALAQAHEVKDRLAAAHPELAAEGSVEIVVIKTTGDRIQDRALMEIGGKGLFTKEIEEALLEGRIDVAVHSMKDVPTWLPDGLAIAAILEREDPRDAWFARGGQGLAGLPAGAVVGTAALRRQAQVLHARPDLTVATLRGNVQTRLAKLERGEVDATLLALAAWKSGSTTGPRRPGWRLSIIRRALFASQPSGRSWPSWTGPAGRRSPRMRSSTIAAGSPSPRWWPCPTAVSCTGTAGKVRPPRRPSSDGPRERR
jgi:hypothetical protein